MKVFAIKALLLTAVVSLSSSCALMLPDRSFIEQMEREDGGMFTPGKDFPMVSGDTGEVRRSREEVRMRTPSSERSIRQNRESESLVEELRSKEERLEDYELDRYAKDKKFLQTDSDKLYYLSLDSEERKIYVASKKSDLKDDLENRKDMVKRRSVHSNELYLGMAKDDVVSAWGKPARVEIAGNPANQNERWSFVEDGSIKQVYFESGTVHGWALDL